METLQNRQITSDLIKTYPLFVPPIDLAEKGHINWTKKEARNYFEWFMSMKDTRLNFFLNFFDIQYSTDPEVLFEDKFSKWIFHLFDNNENLISVKKRVAPENASPEIKYIIERDPPRQEFNNLGYSIAADSGLLCAKIVTDNRADLVWDIALAGGKRYINYHKAVLKNPNNDISTEWDPIATGISNIGYAIISSRSYYDYKGTTKSRIEKK